MIFRRRKPAPVPEITNDGFRRWLRAHRPPLQWFFALAVEEQEVMASIGDEFAVRSALDIGYAVRDPQLAEDGMKAAGGDAAAEASLALRLARGVAEAIERRAAPAPQPAPPQGFAGLGARRVSDVAHAPRRSRSLFGREPDSKGGG